MWIKLILVIFLITLVLDFTRDFYKSLYYCFKNPKDPFSNFLGMVGFLGYYGQGKSMALTHTINRWREVAKKHNKKLKVYTNYYYNGQDGQLESFADIERLCMEKMENKDDDTYIIFAIDELQNVMNSRNWNDTKKFETLMSIFTQTRKLKVMFLYTSPVASMSDKSIRISSKDMYYCKKVNRYFFIRWRLSPNEIECNNGKMELSLFPSAHTLLDKKLMDSYNSFDFVKSMSKKEYLKDSEMNNNSIVNNNFVNVKNKKR